MNEPEKQAKPARSHEAIDVGDFVYAATGARVRRLTMPDGTHWFPAVDVCKELGYASPGKALADHVPETHRESLESVSSAYGLSIPAGRQWRRDLQLIDIQGLLVLVMSCTKRTAAPFKEWATEVLVTVHEEGSYTLEEAEVQPTEPGAPVAYAMPEQVAEAIVRLEAHNLQLDEQLANGQRELIELQKSTLAVQQAMVRAMERIADRIDELVLERRKPYGPPMALPTTESVLADWRQRLSVTEDVWTVAVVIAPVLVERGELREPLESIAARTGLTVHRVNECLRLLRKHACIHSRGGTEEGAPVYVLNRI
ncbi:BRO family protein [Streptomyces sp. NPDC048254]|uniref:BRO-N domain-containing protein n=1 Tax=Streptomyces sp. NPDC048254 TaxID=3365525 RepID=UPI003713060E